VRIDRNNARCEACDAEFPRRESITDTKGVLECPSCGATGDVVLIEE
jgi:Zn finger protein HypA/HybF involved in hydrogenase expression